MTLNCQSKCEKKRKSHMVMSSHGIKKKAVIQGSGVLCQQEADVISHRNPCNRT